MGSVGSVIDGGLIEKVISGGQTSSGSDFTPNSRHHRNQQSDADCAFESQNNEHPLEGCVPAQSKANAQDSEQSKRMKTAERHHHQGQHPDNIKHQHGAPAERSEFRQTERPWISVAGNLFDAEVPLAHDELPDFEGQKQGDEKD
jgi:hypothetical protein